MLFHEPGLLSALSLIAETCEFLNQSFGQGFLWNRPSQFKGLVNNFPSTVRQAIGGGLPGGDQKRIVSGPDILFRNSPRRGKKSVNPDVFSCFIFPKNIRSCERYSQKPKTLCGVR